jgi:hypothetical protein
MLLTPNMIIRYGTPSPLIKRSPLLKLKPSKRQRKKEKGGNVKEKRKKL